MRVTVRRPFLALAAATALVGAPLCAPSYATAAPSPSAPAPGAPKPGATTVVPATGPSFTVAWTPPTVLHENWGPGGWYPVTVTNDGDVPLTVKSATLAGEEMDLQGRGMCTDLAPGATCSFPISDTLGRYDYPGPAAVTLAVTMLTPTGVEVTRTVTNEIPVADDKPEPDFRVVTLPPVEAGRQLAYCSEYIFSHIQREPTTLVSLTSTLVGDLLDPANPRITGRAHQDGFCTEEWVSDIKLKAGDSYTDTVTTVVADDEGNQESSTQTVEWTVPILADARLDLTTTPAAVPETGGTTQLTATVSNTGNVPLTVGDLATSDGRRLVSGGVVRTLDGVACAGGTTLAPKATLTCRYRSQVLSGQAGHVAWPTVRLSASYAGKDGPVAVDRVASIPVMFIDVPPALDLALTGPGTVAKGAVFTTRLRMTGTSSEAGVVRSVQVTGATVLGTSCAPGATLADGRSVLCDVTLRAPAKANPALPITATVTVVDNEGTAVTKKVNRAVTVR